MKESQYFQLRGTCNNEAADYLALRGGNMINKIRSVIHLETFNTDKSIEPDAPRD